MESKTGELVPYQQGASCLSDSGAFTGKHVLCTASIVKAHHSHPAQLHQACWDICHFFVVTQCE